MQPLSFVTDTLKDFIRDELKDLVQDRARSLGKKVVRRFWVVQIVDSIVETATGTSPVGALVDGAAWAFDKAWDAAFDSSEPDTQTFVMQLPMFTTSVVDNLKVAEAMRTSAADARITTRSGRTYSAGWFPDAVEGVVAHRGDTAAARVREYLITSPPRTDELLDDYSERVSLATSTSHELVVNELEEYLMQVSAYGTRRKQNH